MKGLCFSLAPVFVEPICQPDQRLKRIWMLLAQGFGAEFMGACEILLHVLQATETPVGLAQPEVKICL